MSKYNTRQAHPKSPTQSQGWAGQKKVAYGALRLGLGLGWDGSDTVPAATGPVANDLYYMCKLPKGALIFGGRIKGNRVASGTSAGSTALQLAIGLDGPFKDVTGTVYSTYASGASALGLVSVDYSRISGVFSSEQMNMELAGLLLSTGPLLTQADQNAIVQVAVAPSSFISGSTLALEVDYLVQEQS